ncbi:MAG: hypothetical protein EA385_10330 [Salinarimonadaceae bacterium]|nr:MAG: hypothetical protein EA385_10330 [Salinarimonadaceae bacterium]
MRRNEKKLFGALVTAFLLAAPASSGQTLDPTLPLVSPSEQEFNAILRLQREQGRRTLEVEQFRFESNALRSRELFERSMPPVRRPPCREDEPGC